MTVPLICPATHQRLREVGWQLVSENGMQTYPIVNGVPVCIPDVNERASLVELWASCPQPERVGSPLAFYNQPSLADRYWRAEMREIRDDILIWLNESSDDGVVLEVGSGNGLLQGIGSEYVAFDYSLSALQKYVSKRFQRVCGTAEALPFDTETFAFMFSVATFEHVIDVNRAFHEVDRVLRPSGVAYLRPAWHCTQHNCDGIPVRPMSELSAKQKLIKLLWPVHQSRVYKGLRIIPWRVARHLAWIIRGRTSTTLHVKQLRPSYSEFWMSDADATSRLDVYDAILFFKSRGYDILKPSSRVLEQLLAPSTAVVVRKPK